MQYISRILFAGILCFSQWAGAAESMEGELSIGMATPSPTGISVKYWSSRSKAYDIFAEWSFDSNKINFHFDYLTHNFSESFFDDADTPVYYGMGARFIDEDNEDVITGIRFPIGMSYLSYSTPFDIFAEVAPRVNLTPSTNFGVDFLIGIRYRLNSSSKTNNPDI